MKWTRKKPTTLGWYWKRTKYANGFTEPMPKEYHTVKMFAQDERTAKKFGAAFCQWAGPLTLPPSRPSEGEG